MKKKKNNNYFINYVLYNIIGAIVLILPLAIVGFINRDTYFVYRNALSVSFGGVILMSIFVLQVKEMTKKFNAIVWTSIILLILYLLKSIISDSILLVGMALIGQIAHIPFKYLVERNKRLYLAYEDARIKQTVNKENVKEITDAIKSVSWR